MVFESSEVGKWIPKMGFSGTLGSGMNVALRLLNFGFFSRGYALIKGGYG